MTRYELKLLAWGTNALAVALKLAWLLTLAGCISQVQATAERVKPPHSILIPAKPPDSAQPPPIHPVDDNIPPRTVDVPAAEADSKSDLTLDGQPNCEPCETAEKALVAAGWKVTANRDRSTQPGWVRRLEIYPVIHWRVGQQTWYVAGWPGLTEFTKRHHRTKHRLVMTAAGTGPVEAVTPGIGGSPLRPRLLYGSVPSGWDWPGDLREHLRESPHNLSRRDIDNMTDAELVAWHDAWHNQHDAKSNARERRHANRSKRFGGIQLSLACPWCN